MSANVWFEEVNIGLLKELKDTIRIKDANGVLVPLENKALIIRKPEEDFKIETFPCISIYNLSYKHDPIRYNPEPVKVDSDVTNKTVTMEDSAVPFNLTYQIDFWSKYQSDMDCMTRTWLMKHFRQFNMKVIDDGGEERSCNCFTLGSITKSDLILNKERYPISNKERLFHSIIKIQIWVELDDKTRYNKPMVIRRKIGIEET